MPPIALDATYSLGSNLSGVGVYSREILYGLAAAHPEARFRWCYRTHRVLRSLGEALPSNASRRVIAGLLPPPAQLFHGLNQRLPQGKFARALTTFHDLFVLSGDYSTPEFRARFAAQARDAVSRSDVIICVSRFTADQVRDLLAVDEARIRVVHHGVRARPLPDVPREPVALFVGAVQRRKNVARIVRAFRALPADWKLVIAGAAGFGAAEAMAAIDESPARDRIEVTGYVSDAELTRLYARASLCVFPSLDEGFGMPVLEAMAAGVAVITSNRSALLEVAGDAALLVDPQREEEIASAMTVLAGDAAKREELQRRGKERAQHFTWRKAVDETWSAYGTL